MKGNHEKLQEKVGEKNLPERLDVGPIIISLLFRDVYLISGVRIL